ncbi:hypothetical protein GCM10020000_15900 [Streptomyces olivoverticillatus]
MCRLTAMRWASASAVQSWKPPHGAMVAAMTRSPRSCARTAIDRMTAMICVALVPARTSLTPSKTMSVRTDVWASTSRSSRWPALTPLITELVPAPG